MPVAIVTDSTSDIEPQRAAGLGIDIVPLFVIWNDRSYRDDIDLSRRDFYRKLAADSNLPTTSQPSIEMFEEAFAPHVQRGEDIFCTTLSSKLSGTFETARAAAQRFASARIEVFDSESVAGGLGMIATHARELAAQGAPLETIRQAVERQRARQRLYACLPDLSHVMRTGRIGRARGAIGTLMKIVPVLTLKDGRIEAEAQVRTFARAQETMIDLALENVADVRRGEFLVMHTNAPQLADAIANRVRDRLTVPPKMLAVQEAGPVVAVHGGPGAVGIFSNEAS